MTKSPQEFQPDDQDLPEGWEPANDCDPRWEQISTLLCEADKPQPLDEALVSNIHLSLRRKLREEGLVKTVQPPASAGDTGFLEWLRQVFFGGGPSGQIVRLGVACGAAFFVGLTFQGAESPSRDTVSVAEVAPSGQTGSMTPASTATEVADAGTLSVGEPTPQPAGRLDRGAAASIDEQDDWSTTAPGGGWIYHHSLQPQMRQVSASASQAGQRSESRARTMTEVIDQLQILKLNSMVSQDEQSLAEIRRIERALASLSENVEAEDSPHTRAVELFQRAEHAAAAQRYDDALRHFDNARALAPGSALAFFCEFQSGRISLEVLQDYPAALDSFRRCLNSYPANIVNGQRRAYLESRIQLLKETAADEWVSLHAWQAAEKTKTGVDAVPHLLEVVRVTSSPTLLADSSRLLADHLIRDTNRGNLNATEVASAIEKRLAQLGSNAVSARMGFALGEIYARRFQDYPRALEEYRAALERGPDQSLEGALRLRISQMLDERLTGLSHIE
ncbi:MAG: tetratricopeptide repeat protein [Candidatus Sumerlaeia bacterium]|nr:tetratricopeptide repeat protein [Candidatus Sumerlaeia bacterium]